MSRNNKLFTIALLGGGALAGYGYYVKMKRTTTELEVIPEASIYSVNWNGIAIQLNLLLKNPTKGSFSIKFPFVKLTYKNTLVGSSQAVDKDIVINGYGQAKIDGILIDIPVLSIFTVSTSILKAMQQKEPVKLTATMMTAINLGLFSIPFEESHEVVLSK